MVIKLANLWKLSIQVKCVFFFALLLKIIIYYSPNTWIKIETSNKRIEEPDFLAFAISSIASMLITWTTYRGVFTKSAKRMARPVASPSTYKVQQSPMGECSVWSIWAI